jgi:hypothetical protein
VSGNDIDSKLEGYYDPPSYSESEGTRTEKYRLENVVKKLKKMKIHSSIPELDKHLFSALSYI